MSIRDVTFLSVTEDVTLVTLYNMASEISFISDLFTRISQADVNVDMISQTAPMGGNISISFTIPDARLSAVLSIIGRCRSEHPGLRAEVSSSNIKLSFFGDSMRTTPGVAAAVFAFFSELGVDAKIITTSEVDISCLVDKSLIQEHMSLLRERFGGNITWTT